MNGSIEEGAEEHKPKPEPIISKEQSKLAILNPTMKEISKLDNQSIDDDDIPDVLGEFKKKNEENEDRKVEIDKEEDEVFINHIHRMSMRKLEIGRMRSKLISNSVNKDKYVDEVNIDKERALKMADNIFKRRLKHINRNKIIELDSHKNNSDYIQFSPQPFIKRLISGGRIDTEYNSLNDKIKRKKEEIIGSTDGYKDNVTKTEYNIESYTSKNNNRPKKDSEIRNIEIKSNQKTLLRNNVNSRSYTNIRENKIDTSKGSRNNNQNVVQKANEKNNININKNDKSKGITYNDIKEHRYNRNNNSQTNSLRNIVKVNNTSPTVIISSNLNSGNPSRRNATNIIKVNSPNVQSSNSPRSNNMTSINSRSNNMASINSRSNNMTSINSRSNNMASISKKSNNMTSINSNRSNNIASISPKSNNMISISPKSNYVKNTSNTNANKGQNNTRRNKADNEVKIIPISLPLNKINKQLSNDNLLQKANNTSREYNRSPLNKPLEIDIKNNIKRNPNKEGQTSIQKGAITAANEPRRRNVNNQVNSKDTKKMPQKAPMGNQPNTSGGNERNKIDTKNQAATASRGNEKNKVEIKNQAAKISRRNEKNIIEIKTQVPSNRRGNNQIDKKSPVKVENKKVVTTAISNKRGKK